jgi:hypothetical protein
MQPILVLFLGEALAVHRRESRIFQPDDNHYCLMKQLIVTSREIYHFSAGVEKLCTGTGKWRMTVKFDLYTS